MDPVESTVYSFNYNFPMYLRIGAYIFKCKFTKWILFILKRVSWQAEESLVKGLQ